MCDENNEIMKSFELNFSIILFEHVREKTNNLVSDEGPTQTGLYNHRSRLEA